MTRLEKRGWTVSREGVVAVQPTGERRLDHERYLDATQRYAPLFLPEKFYVLKSCH
jgi:hypothetical protein